MMTDPVLLWWYCLCSAAALNVLAWTLSCAALRRRRPFLSSSLYTARRWQLWLSALYVAGCAYRSVFLIYDVPRICLFDTAFSAVAVGRSVATIAELAFVAQWALLLWEAAQAGASRFGQTVARLIVPLIAVAETCSWYSILTTSNIGHVAEESLWGICAALLVASVVALLPRAAPDRRPLLVAWCVAGLAYVTFMFSVDIPMYWNRWLADTAAGRGYLTIAQGLLDMSQRRIVSHQWQDWKHEVAWMSLYFSVAVWISISLIHAPAPRPHSVRERRRFAKPALDLA